jgi:hypothetical protein
MTQFHFFHVDTGVLHGTSVVTNVADEKEAHAFAKSNAPDGHDVIAGSYSSEKHRVDVATGNVLDYQPAAPPVDHEWNATTKRWQLPATTMAALEYRQFALEAIAKLEASQARAVREALLGVPGTLDRLKVLDAQIAALRPQLAP